MEWNQIVEALLEFAEGIKDKRSTVDIDAADSCAEIRMTTGGIEYKLYLSGED